jgi:hypothetical protein
VINICLPTSQFAGESLTVIVFYDGMVDSERVVLVLKFSFLPWILRFVAVMIVFWPVGVAAFKVQVLALVSMVYVPWQSISKGFSKTAFLISSSVYTLLSRTFWVPTTNLPC